MWRWLAFLVVLCIAVLAVVWMVQNPGAVVLEWQGWRLETSIGVLFGAVIFIAAITAMVYRFWRFLRRAPGEVGAAMRNRRQRKGFRTLSGGMVALAAGDATEARRSARRAEALLDEKTPLTRLLSAQSAQLDGDEKAAERFFTEMLDNKETRFLGLRGLLTQAVKDGNRERALELAEDAYYLRPDSEWVATTYFELTSTKGQWPDAERINDDMMRADLLPRPDANRRRGIIAFERARDEEAADELKQLKRAVDLAPDLIPAGVALMQRYVSSGQHRKASNLAEKIWVTTPHPDLLEPYWEARHAADGLQRMKASERLANTNKDHIESHIALARAALGAELWGEARKHLKDAGAGEGIEPPARVCRLMAEAEERENGDLAKAQEWLMRAQSAPADPKWVCGECGNAVAIWTAHCGNCETFDSYAWGEPPHISGLPAPAKEQDPPPLADDAAASLDEPRDPDAAALPPAQS